jgi:hypothetical protein
MSIIAYTYCAAVHCSGCTRADLIRLKVDNTHPNAHAINLPRVSELDEHGVHINSVDIEGNLVRPVSTDDSGLTDLTCSDCLTS